MEQENNAAKVSKAKPVKWVTFIRPVTLLLIMVLLLTYISYAWLRRSWTPYVEQEGITIATSGSLVFKLEDYSSTTAGMSINDILKLQEDFVLKPVSNRHGNSDGFFTLNLFKGEGNESYQYLDVSKYDDDNTAMGVDNGYIEFKLMLMAPSDPNKEDNVNLLRYIYIHDDSHIKISKGSEDHSEVVNCIRVSVTLVSTQKTYIFVPEVDGDSIVHMGINDGLDEATNDYVSNGVKYYETYVGPNSEGNVETTQVKYKNGKTENLVLAPNAEVNNHVVNVGEFGDYNGLAADGVTYDANKTLFTLDSTSESSEWIIVRVWAEGTHKDCTEEIAGAQIDLKLKFASFTVEKQVGEG